MKAYRNIGGIISEIEVDVDMNGNPILPPHTTVDPKPEPSEGHYVTVVDHSWVEIPIPTSEVSLDTLKQEALAKLKEYKEWYLDQPVDVNGYLMDADELSRSRVSQALVVHSATGYLPPAWITHDNTEYPIAAIEDLVAIATGLQGAFATRFFEVNSIKQQIANATTVTDLEAIEVPSIPMDDFMH